MKDIFSRSRLRFWVTLLICGVALWWLGRDAACRPLARPSGPAPISPDPQAVNLQDSFAQVAAIIKPAVVSINTVHVESVAVPYQFYFGDPFEEFFGRPSQPRRRAPRAHWSARSRAGR